MKLKFLFFSVAFLPVVYFSALANADDTKNPVPKLKPKQDVVGLAINENKATPIDRIKVPKDFKVELLYSVPGPMEGSWVNLCLDDKGRILASDQYLAARNGNST